MNMQVEALHSPGHVTTFHCSWVKGKTFSKGSGANLWHSKMNSARRVYLYKRCGVEICKRSISNSQSYQFTGYGASSRWMGWKALQRLYVWLRPQPNSVEQNLSTNIKWANSNLFANCTDCLIRTKLGLWEPDLVGQSQLKENREYNIFLETALFAYRASQDNRRLGQACLVFIIDSLTADCFRNENKC